MVDVVAHRAGNTISGARSARALGHMIELDVHSLRGRLEVRHEKVLWPTARLWEKWYLLPSHTTVPALTEVLDATGHCALLVDVKSPTRATARRIAKALEGRDRVVVSSRMWWTLGAFSSRPGWTTLRSCGNWLQLWLAIKLQRTGTQRGIAIHERLMTPEVAADLNGSIYVWGARDAQRCEELLEFGIAGIILDDVDLVGPTISG